MNQYHHHDFDDLDGLDAPRGLFNAIGYGVVLWIAIIGLTMAVTVYLFP